MSTNRTIVATAGLLLALLVLVGSVSAVPSVSISPTSGDVGDTVTITGTGFNATENVSVWYGTDQVERIWSTTNKAWENITYPSINATMNPASGKYYAIADAQGFWKLKFDTFAPYNWYDMNQTVDVTVEDANGNQIGAATPYSGGPDGVVFDVNDPVVTINTTSGGDNTPIQINVSNLRRHDKIDAISFGIGKQLTDPLHPNMATEWNSFAGNWGNVTTPQDVSSTGWVSGTAYTVQVQILKNSSSSVPEIYTCSDTFTYTGEGTGGPWMWLNATRLSGSEKTGDWGVADVGSSTTLPNINSFDGSKYGELYPLAFRVANFSTGKEIAANSITVGGTSTVHAKDKVSGDGTKTNTTFYPVNLSSTVSMGPATVNIGGSEFTAISSQPYANTSSSAGISLSASSGSKGDTVYAYGYGFDTNVRSTGYPENITLLFSNQALNCSDQGAGSIYGTDGLQIAIDDRGAFAVNFTVPKTVTAGKTYTVYAFSNFTGSNNPELSGSVLRDQASFEIPAAVGEPTITLNKTSANVDEEVGIKFENFEPAERAKVTMDDGTVLNSSMFTSAGYHKFTVPTKSGGTYTITATNTSEDKTADATFTIAPKIKSITPAALVNVTAGDIATVKGSGFKPTTHYAIIWDAAEYSGSQVIGDFFSTSGGAIPTDTGTFEVPSSINGPHLIDIAEYDTPGTSVMYGNYLFGQGSAYPYENFTGGEYFNVQPSSAIVGQSVTVTGTNIAEGDDNVTMTDWNGEDYIWDVTSGTVGPETWTVPFTVNDDRVPGVTMSLDFVGGQTETVYGSVPMLIYDNITVVPSTAAPGQSVTISGDGLGAGLDYYVFLNQSSTATDVFANSFTSTVNTGKIPPGTTFTVPTSMAEGDYKVLLVDRMTFPTGGGVISNNDKPTLTVAGALDHVTVTPSEATLEVGDNYQFTATAYDADGNELSGTAAWTSSNTDVAKLDSPGKPGLVTAYANGTSTITASITIGSVTKSDTATVNVGGAGPTPTIDSITVTPSTWNMQVGETVDMTAMGYSGSEPVELTTATWSSDATGVATVSGSAGSGTATGAGAGTATISVAQEGVTGTATLNVYTDITDAYRDPSTGTVTKANAVDAVNDYLFNNQLSKTDAVAVVDEYLFG